MRPPAPSVLLEPPTFPPFPSDLIYSEAALLIIVVFEALVSPIRPPAELPAFTWSAVPEPETAASVIVSFVTEEDAAPRRPPAVPFSAVTRIPYSFSVPLASCPASPQSCVFSFVVRILILFRDSSPADTFPTAPPAAVLPVTSRELAERLISSSPAF